MQKKITQTVTNVSIRKKKKCFKVIKHKFTFIT